MRVTESVIVGTVLRNIQRSFETREELQRRLATGKKVALASDGPADAAEAFRLRSAVRREEQYSRNAAMLREWLDAQDAALSQACDVLQRARDLAVQGASDTNDYASRRFLALEVAQLFGHLLQIANSRFGGQFLFGGSRTEEAPFLPDGTYVGNADRLEREVGFNLTVPAGLDGGAVFGPAFAALVSLRAALESGSGSDISDRIGDIDAALDNILAVRAEVGARRNRVDDAGRLADEKVYTAQRLLAEVEDADLPLTAVQLSAAEAGYQFALKAGAYLVRSSLLDFLR
ncbi:flagellar hook-associated protein 3 FlgL [Thermanaeromonas toyohensis ToBE]|uniref:Flagellar hook-associated protein 3 FlgL n=1 Tax=Thermanaeromonas toyohensis ToBE TaxID=698762 RepID=A0A1W1VTB9_9FIRM|nr:flagellar hook-associated protein FlgL [Thermanaeromonas toyohensis]SMB96612.1 flagellar hook-associated protein 3 FlgL [Thermanaeromonas toyohensis ToBE]